MASEIADGMAYIDRLNYIHGFLAARNVLVGEHNTVKVCRALEGSLFTDIRPPTSVHCPFKYFIYRITLCVYNYVIMGYIMVNCNCIPNENYRILRYARKGSKLENKTVVSYKFVARNFRPFN